MLAFFEELVRSGIDFHRHGDKLTWTAPEGGGLTPAQVEAVRENKALFLAWTEPQPDMVEDSEPWQRVLREALRRERSAWGLLHGLRCGGCTIAAQEGGTLKLDFSAVLEDMPDIRSRWLLPHRKVLTKIFAAAAQLHDEEPRRTPGPMVEASCWVGGPTDTVTEVRTWAD